MSFQKRCEQANHLRGIPLEAVLRAACAEPDRLDKAKWHTAQGVLSVQGMKFMNWNQGHGGGGAIDLAMHLNATDFRTAIAWL
ncbi:MAG: mobilization protein, partial [bacterium]